MDNQVIDRWQNQEEALEFSLQHPSCMLDMEMGTGKTRVALDAAFVRPDVHKILVVCPKAVIGVWRTNLEKFHHREEWECFDRTAGSVVDKTNHLHSVVYNTSFNTYLKLFVIVNYDIVWRKPMGDYLLRAGFDMVILDESHRAKSAGSKVSKYLAMLGKRVKYRMCLSGTPMANSTLDVYGQYRFLDPSIFGTNHDKFMQEYAIMGGPERQWVIGYKNQQKLMEKFQSIAYTCKMSDIKDRLKLPDVLPPVKRTVTLPANSMRILKTMAKEFIAECGEGFVVLNNALTKVLRMQQITSGFCQVQDSPMDNQYMYDLNTAKEESLMDWLQDIDPQERIVVFCMFKHDLDTVKRVADKLSRPPCELSGRANNLNVWQNIPGAILAVQIQAGAEGIDLTKSNHVMYFSLPHSLALYEQSKARLYRPGQTRPVEFTHLVAAGTIDEVMYKSLEQKKDIIESIKDGTLDFGFIKV